MKKSREANQTKLMNRRVHILKPPLMNRPFKIGILMNHQKLTMSYLTLNRQLQTGLVQGEILKLRHHPQKPLKAKEMMLSLLVWATALLAIP